MGKGYGAAVSPARWAPPAPCRGSHCSSPEHHRCFPAWSPFQEKITTGLWAPAESLPSSIRACVHCLVMLPVTPAWWPLSLEFLRGLSLVWLSQIWSGVGLVSLPPRPGLFVFNYLFHCCMIVIAGYEAKFGEDIFIPKFAIRHRVTNSPTPCWPFSYPG